MQPYQKNSEEPLAKNKGGFLQSEGSGKKKKGCEKRSKNGAGQKSQGKIWGSLSRNLDRRTARSDQWRGEKLQKMRGGMEDEGGGQGFFFPKKKRPEKSNNELQKGLGRRGSRKTKKKGCLSRLRERGANEGSPTGGKLVPEVERPS